MKAIKETVFDRYEGMMKEIRKKRSKVDSTHLFLVTEAMSSVKPAHLTNGAGVSRAFIDQLLQKETRVFPFSMLKKAMRVKKRTL